MAEIYVPIDSSPAKNIIPVGEDIIYSTLCQAKISGTPGPRYVRTSSKKWLTHFLITKNGLAFTTPVKKKPLQLSYYDWVEVRGVGFSRIEIMVGFLFKLARDENSETKEDFKKRKKEFTEKFKLIMNERKKEWEEKFPNKKERRQEIAKRSVEIYKVYKDKKGE